MNGANMTENEQQTENLILDESTPQPEAKQLSPEEVASNFFRNYYPSYKLLVKKLNKKDAIRLADSLVGWPLEVNDPKFFSKDAKQAFWVANQLLDCKLIIRSAVEFERMQQAMDQNETVNIDNVIEGEANNG